MEIKISKRFFSQVFAWILLTLGVNYLYHGQILACAFFRDISKFEFLTNFFEFPLDYNVNWKSALSRKPLVVEENGAYFRTPGLYVYYI